MAVFGRQQVTRRRTRRFDVEAAAKGKRGGLVSVLAPKHLVATLVSVLFWAVQSLVVVIGVPGGLDGMTAAGVACLLLGVHLIFGWYLSLHHRDVLRDRRRLLLLQSLTLCVIAVAKIFTVFGWPPYVLPLGIFSVALSIGIGQRLSAFWTLLAAGAIGLIAGLESYGELGRVTIDLPLTATLATGSLVAVFALDRVSRRGKVVRAGFYAGVAFAMMVFVTHVLLPGEAAGLRELREDPWSLALLMALGFLNGMLTGYFLVEIGLRFVEGAFDVVTDLRLQELADLNQPILKKFAIEAPGTFHHSQMVGTLAEAAAESIRANALLCRVGAHFHDIGKMAKPEYFIENVRGATRHDNLTPTMSTLIIIGHVKDGIEIGEELGLPSRVIDLIPEHHGTIAVEYFYHRAKKQQGVEGGPSVSRDDFRYPGPKPRSKEAAILMIADTVEAMSRVLEDPNPSRVEAMVHDVVMRRLMEGQLDDCSVTIRELKDVERAMVRVLLGAHHGRIKYPKPSADDLVALKGGDSGSHLREAARWVDGPGLPSAAALGKPEQDAQVLEEPGARAREDADEERRGDDADRGGPALSAADRAAISAADRAG